MLPFSKFSDTSIIGWVEGYSLIKNKVIFVPAIAVYLSYEMIGHDEYLFNNTSSGLATGSSYIQAILSGLLEVIERDAFLITWLCRLPMPQINTESLKCKHSQNIIEMYNRRGIQIYINALVLDTGIPTFLATAIDMSNNGPAVVIGLSSDINSELGILKALQKEIGQIRPHLKQVMLKPEYRKKISEMNNFQNVKKYR